MNEDKITDQATYLNRRTFMRVAALAGTATATTLLYRRLNPPPPFPVEGEKLNDVAKTNDANGFNTVEQLTAIEAITNYNNFYEFDTTKDGVASAAKGFVTRPWASNFQTNSIANILRRFRNLNHSGQDHSTDWNYFLAKVPKGDRLDCLTQLSARAAPHY